MDELLAAIREQTEAIRQLTAKNDSLPLNEIAANYASKISWVTTTALAWQQVVKPNANRWYIRFEADSGGGAVLEIVPDPPDQSQPQSTVSSLPVEYKFRDCPSIVAGAFWLFAAAGNKVRVYECIYMR